jgi:hypothetical protein
MSLPLPDGLLDLLRRPSPCFVATVMADGRQKARNIARDTRVAVNAAEPDDTACRRFG